MPVAACDKDAYLHCLDWGTGAYRLPHPQTRLRVIGAFVYACQKQKEEVDLKCQILNAVSVQYLVLFYKKVRYSSPGPFWYN